LASPKSWSEAAAAATTVISASRSSKLAHKNAAGKLPNIKKAAAVE